MSNNIVCSLTRSRNSSSFSLFYFQSVVCWNSKVYLLLLSFLFVDYNYVWFSDLDWLSSLDIKTRENFASYFPGQILICTYTIYLQVQMLVACTIHSGSLYPIGSTCACTFSGSVCNICYYLIYCFLPSSFSFSPSLFTQNTLANIIYYLLVFTPALTGSISLESEWQVVSLISRTLLSILDDFRIAVLVLTFPLDSSSFSFSSRF